MCLNVRGFTLRIRRILVQIPLDVWPGSQTQPLYEAHNDIRVESRIKCSDEHQVSEAAPLTVVQSWLWGNQVAGVLP